MNMQNLKKWAGVALVSLAFYLLWRNLENRVGLIGKLAKLGGGAA